MMHHNQLDTLPLATAVRATWCGVRNDNAHGGLSIYLQFYYLLS
jgi:hypothetical protein